MWNTERMCLPDIRPYSAKGALHKAGREWCETWDNKTHIGKGCFGDKGTAAKDRPFVYQRLKFHGAMGYQAYLFDDGVDAMNEIQCTGVCMNKNKDTCKPGCYDGHLVPTLYSKQTRYAINAWLNALILAAELGNAATCGYAKTIVPDVLRGVKPTHRCPPKFPFGIQPLYFKRSWYTPLKLGPEGDKREAAILKQAMQNMIPKPAQRRRRRRVQLGKNENDLTLQDMLGEGSSSKAKWGAAVKWVKKAAKTVHRHVKKHVGKVIKKVKGFALKNLKKLLIRGLMKIAPLVSRKIKEWLESWPGGEEFAADRCMSEALLPGIAMKAPWARKIVINEMKKDNPKVKAVLIKVAYETARKFHSRTRDRYIKVLRKLSSLLHGVVGTTLLIDPGVHCRWVESICSRWDLVAHPDVPAFAFTEGGFGFQDGSKAQTLRIWGIRATQNWMKKAIMNHDNPRFKERLKCMNDKTYFDGRNGVEKQDVYNATTKTFDFKVTTSKSVLKARDPTSGGGCLPKGSTDYKKCRFDEYVTFQNLIHNSCFDHTPYPKSIDCPILPKCVKPPCNHDGTERTKWSWEHLKGLGPPMCAAYVEIAVNRCSTCCCKEGLITSTAYSQEVVRTDNMQCGTWFATYFDVLVRAQMLIERAKVMLNDMSPCLRPNIYKDTDALS